MIFPKKNTGFTLIELLVVIAIMLILMTIVLTSLNKNKDLATDQARVADLQTIRLALEEYRVACFEYPNKIYNNASNGRCPEGITFSSFLPQVPTDNGTDYQYVGLSNIAVGKCYDYYISAQMIYGAEDDDTTNPLLQEDEFSDFSDWPYSKKCDGTNSNVNFAPLDDEDSIYNVRSSQGTN